jgi:lactoylglutathione lyase
MTDVTTQSVQVVQEFGDLIAAGDPAAYDRLATDFVNHAAGPQGREGFRTTMSVIDHDLADVTYEQERLVAQGDLVVNEVRMLGTHRASTMPLLAGIEPKGVRVTWTYVHTWRVADGLIVEHWATRDDLGLLLQLGAWAPGA